jgi:hypothetical protein
MTFYEWLKKSHACSNAVAWVESQPDQSIDALMAACPRGEWILWCYQRAGYAPDVLAPVAYAATNRAMRYAADALDATGMEHGLREIVVSGPDTARAAAEAAADAAEAAADAASAEHALCADDCRAMLPKLVIEEVV